jgi:hypothetical protein
MERVDRLFVEEDLFGRLGWFIKIRWAFLAGLITALVTAFRFQIGLPYQKILAVGGFIFAYNTALTCIIRSRPESNPIPANPDRSQPADLRGLRLALGCHPLRRESRIRSFSYTCCT